MGMYASMLKKINSKNGRSDILSGGIKEKESLIKILEKLSIYESIKEIHGIDISDSSQFSVESLRSVDDFFARVTFGVAPGAEIYVGRMYLDSRDLNNHEVLLKITHPTGPCILGGHPFSQFYPREFFNEFIEEVIKKTSPKYFDPSNNTLYYNPHDTLFVIEEYPKILKEYRQKVHEEYEKHEEKIWVCKPFT